MLSHVSLSNGGTLICTAGTIGLLNLAGSGTNYDITLADDNGYCTVSDGIVAENSAVTVENLLKDHQALHAGDGLIPRSETIESIQSSFKNLWVGACDFHKKAALEDTVCQYCGTDLTSGMQAMIEETGRYCETLEMALNAVQENQTVKLLGEINSTSFIKKSMTIDLNGHNIDDHITIRPGNTLTLDGSGIVSVVQSGTYYDGIAGGALNVVSDSVTVGTLSVQHSPTPAMQLSKGTYWKIETKTVTANELLADGYAFALSDGTVKNGHVEKLSGVKIVPHEHDTSAATCVCGYTCAHKNVGADGKCIDCGMQQAAKLMWIDGETDNTDYAQSADAAVQKVKSLNDAGITNITVTLLTDLDSEWVITDGGTFKLTTADGVALTKSITVDGETDVTVIGGTYGSKPSVHFTITYRNNGKISLAGGGFYELDVSDDASIYAPGISSIMADGYAFFKKDADGNEYVTDYGHLASFSGADEPIQIKRHTQHTFKQQTYYGGDKYYGCDCGLQAVASITTGENTVYYSDLQDAFDSAKGGDTIVLCGLYAGSIQLQKDITVNNYWSWQTPVTVDLNNRNILFTTVGYNTPNGHKLIIKDEAAVNIKGNGKITSLYAEQYAMPELYGGTYGTLEKQNSDGTGVLGFCAEGYGLKGTNGWVTSYLTDLATDVTVKKAPFEIKNIIVTTDPNGTEDSAVLYTGQKVYIKATVALEDGEEAISTSNPIECSVAIAPANGIGTPPSSYENQYSAEVAAERTLPNASGDYKIHFSVLHLGCTVTDTAKKITVSVCSHNSYTNGKCDDCGAACTHESVSESGICDICKTQMLLSLTSGSKVTYYTDAAAALADAMLDKNKGCTVKLLKSVDGTVKLTPSHAEQTERTAFTLDLNGYDFGDYNSYIYLQNVDMTVKTSAARNRWTTFYPMIHFYKNASLTCPAVDVDTILTLDTISFTGDKGTNTISLGEGIRLNNFVRPNDGMTLGELLGEGLVFREYDGTNWGNIFLNSDSSTTSLSGTVAKCPHEMQNNTCKYCGFVCSHSKGYTDGKCNSCGTPCLHENVDETTYKCNTCSLQMAVKTEKRSGAIAYSTSLSGAMNAAEDGETFTLLETASLEKCDIIVSDKTVTLNLNGHSITKQTIMDNFVIGIDSEETVRRGKMIVKGEGNIQPGFLVYNTGELDLSGWTGTEIGRFSIRENSLITGMPAAAHIGSLWLNGWNTDSVQNLALSGGSYGQIIWNNFKSIALPLGNLLAPGYAFQSETDNTLLSYTDTLNPDVPGGMTLSDVKVVKCENHADSNGNGKCDYCNSKLAARVNATVYTDLQNAIDESSLSDTIYLLDDVTGSYTINSDRINLNLNGHTLQSLLVTDSGALTLVYDSRINETTPVGPHENVTTASGLTSENYDITYVPGNVTITKIPVIASAGTAKSSYLSAAFDKDLAGLTSANFAVKDSSGNTVAFTGVSASQDNKLYTIVGSFTVGRTYTVKVVLSGAAADATHELTTDEFVITPVRTGGSSGGGGGGGTKAVTYAVAFVTNGGSKIENQTVAQNSAIKEPTAPTKDGFDFAGWYADKALKEKYDFSAKVTSNITLYAAWTKKDNTDEENPANQVILIIGEKAAQVFGQTKANDVAPKIVNDRTMLPARFVAENLGANVSWDCENEIVTIKGKHLKTGENVTIEIIIGSAVAKVNGKEIKLDSEAFVENNRTYTPIRFISEELGAAIKWQPDGQKVIITLPNK